MFGAAAYHFKSLTEPSIIRLYKMKGEPFHCENNCIAPHQSPEPELNCSHNYTLLSVLNSINHLHHFGNYQAIIYIHNLQNSQVENHNFSNYFIYNDKVCRNVTPVSLIQNGLFFFLY